MNWCILTALRSRIILAQIIQSFSLIIITLPPKFVIFNYFTNTLTHKKKTLILKHWSIKPHVSNRIIVFFAWNKLYNYLTCNNWPKDCFVGEFCCELLKSYISGCYGKYFIVANISISISSSSSQLLLPTRFIFLEGICDNLAHFCFCYSFSLKHNMAFGIKWQTSSKSSLFYEPSMNSGTLSYRKIKLSFVFD